MNGNQNAEDKTGVSRKNLLLNGIVILLCVVLGIQIVTFFRESSDYLKGPETDEAFLIQWVSHQNYERLVEDVYRYEALGCRWRETWHRFTRQPITMRRRCCITPIKRQEMRSRRRKNLPRCRRMRSSWENMLL